MVFKIVSVICIQLTILNTAYSQAIGRIVPNCGCSNIEPVLQNPYLINGLPGPLLNNPVVYSNELPSQTTIIQDSTVANNLANALQLLVVSNLLSNTLPLGQCGCGYPLDVAVGPACGCGCNGLSAVGYPLDVAVGPACGCGCNGLSAIGYPLDVAVGPACGCGYNGLSALGYPLDVAVGPACGCGCNGLSALGYPQLGYNVLY